MSAPTTAPVTPGAGTQRFSFTAPVAAFRNPLKPLPEQPVVQADGGKDVRLTQGYAEAIVSANGTAQGKSYPNLLQYLCRDPNSPSWSLQPFAGGGNLCNGAVVIAQVPGRPPSTINCAWIDNNGAFRMASMTGQQTWSGATSPPNPTAYPNKYDPAKWNRELSHLQVAYTPAQANGRGRNPILYATQSDTYLVTVRWTPHGLLTTVYEGLGGGLPYNDLTLVPLDESNFALIANVTGSSDLGLWIGTYGASRMPRASCFSGNPSGSGSGTLRQIAGGALSPAIIDDSSGNPDPSASVCAFYTDSDNGLLAWPASQSRCSPVPTVSPATGLVASTLSGSGSRSNLYLVDGSNAIWLLHQLLWTMDGKEPFFAPPSQVRSGGAGLGVSVLASVQHPAELPALFVVREDGTLALYQLDDDGGRLTHSGDQAAYGANQWSGGPLILANKQPFKIDTRSYA